MITPYAFSTRMSLQSSVRNYFRRNWTNCRMLSKATAQGSVPCVRNTITKTALPTTSSVGTNPTSNPLFFSFSGKKLGTGADRYRGLRQKTRRDHRQGCMRLAQAVQNPKVVRLRRPVPFGTHDKDLPPTFRHLVSIAIRATSLEVVRHPTAASSPACLCVRPRSFRARMLLGCRPKVRFALVFATAAPLRWRAAVAPIDAGSPISRFPSDQNCTVRPVTEWSLLYRLPRALA
jgi:hypothetical protein